MQSKFTRPIRGLHRWLRDGIRPLLRRLNRAAAQQIELQQRLGTEQKEANLRTRAALKRLSGQPLRVVFVCHGRALWSLFESVYREALADPEMQPVVLALPYAHSTLPEGSYRDERIAEFLRPQGIPVIDGVDHRTGEWIWPSDLDADYIFLQTPYRIYHEKWHVENASVHARICYVPYGCTLFSGTVQSVSHPEAFFRHVWMTFTEHAHGQRLFVDTFRDAQWYRPSAFLLTGYPKLDQMLAPGPAPRGVWKRQGQATTFRILWTPRWRTEEGNCHFFDYKDVLADVCSGQNGLELAFRPHPLCLQNFVKTGELTEAELDTLRARYRDAPNMVMDESGDYRDTFLSSSVLVSDVSSLLFEYFATGKPIVYTHRVNVFNELGRTLAEGFYWVHNADELRDTLAMLQRGDDPLAAKRQSLMAEVVRVSSGGAGRAIVRELKRDFFADALVERLADALAVPKRTTQCLKEEA